MRQRESEDEEKNRIELQQRMQALLSLKNNIEGNRVKPFKFHLYKIFLFIPYFISFRSQLFCELLKSFGNREKLSLHQLILQMSEKSVIFMQPSFNAIF